MAGKRVCFQHLPLAGVDLIGSLLSRANFLKGIACFKDDESELYLETVSPLLIAGLHANFGFQQIPV
jgi:hypothetical protein